MDSKDRSEDTSIEVTGDGSPTLYSEQFQAHYHSTHGALQESLHVFIQEGIAHNHALHGQSDISILEYGLGTALNAALTWQYAEQHGLTIQYHGVEGYPVAPTVAAQLDFGSALPRHYHDDIHRLPWGEARELSPHFTIQKEEALFEDLQLPTAQYDIIYFDAFAPTCQSHLWEEPILRATYDALKPGGFLVTFCAKGSFKRVLKALGMTVERVPGPPGKREMTRACKADLMLRG